MFTNIEFLCKFHKFISAQQVPSMFSLIPSNCSLIFFTLAFAFSRCEWAVNLNDPLNLNDPINLNDSLKYEWPPKHV